MLDKVEDELFAFGKALEQQPTLREALTDAALPGREPQGRRRARSSATGPTPSR